MWYLDSFLRFDSSRFFFFLLSRLLSRLVDITLEIHVRISDKGEAKRVGLPVGLVTCVYGLHAPTREFARVDSEFNMAGKILSLKIKMKTHEAKDNIDEAEVCK